MQITLKLTEQQIPIGRRAVITEVLDGYFDNRAYGRVGEILEAFSSSYSGRPYLVNLTRRIVLWEVTPWGNTADYKTFMYPYFYVRLLNASNNNG